MYLKMLKAASAGMILAISGFANAGIIDHGEYTEVNGLDWLDWTTTLGMTDSAAIAANVGWRSATIVEMESLMNAMFPTTFVFDAYGRNNTDVTRVFPAETSTFLALFGATDGNYLSYATAEGAGMIGFDYDIYAGFAPQRYGQASYSASWNGVALVRAVNVPEPSTLAIFAFGMLVLVSHRFKGNK